MSPDLLETHNVSIKLILSFYTFIKPSCMSMQIHARYVTATGTACKNSSCLNIKYYENTKIVYSEELIVMICANFHAFLVLGSLNVNRDMS